MLSKVPINLLSAYIIMTYWVRHAFLLSGAYMIHKNNGVAPWLQIVLALKGLMDCSVNMVQKNMQIKTKWLQNLSSLRDSKIWAVDQAWGWKDIGHIGFDCTDSQYCFFFSV